MSEPGEEWDLPHIIGVSAVVATGVIAVLWLFYAAFFQR